MKPPRDWAHDILVAKSKDDRLRIFNQVPKEMQPIVKTHVTNAVALRRFWISKPRKTWPESIELFIDSLG